MIKIIFHGTPTVRNVYLYAVCFATLIMMIVGLVQGVNGIIEIVYPPPLPSTFYAERVVPADADWAKWQEQAEASRKTEQERERYQRINNLIHNVLLFGIALPIFLYHWKKAEKVDSIPPQGPFE